MYPLPLSTRDQASNYIDKSHPFGDIQTDNESHERIVESNICGGLTGGGGGNQMTMLQSSATICQGIQHTARGNLTVISTSFFKIKKKDSAVGCCIMYKGVETTDQKIRGKTRG